MTDEEYKTMMQLVDDIRNSGDGEDHPMGSREDWRDEVACDNTLEGYYEWVRTQIEMEYENTA